MPVCESSGTPYLCVQGWWGRRTAGRCCRVAWLGAQLRELCRARPGVPAAVGAPVQRGGSGRAPSHPLTVPPAGPAAPAATRARCHQHLQALTDGPMDPARGWRGPETPDPFLSAPQPALSCLRHALCLAWYLTLLFLCLAGCWGLPSLTAPCSQAQTRGSHMPGTV